MISKLKLDREILFLETIIYARLTDQSKFKHQVVFSALFEKLIELGYFDNKTERYISLKIIIL